MERLKVCKQVRKKNTRKNLHSSMERLKAPLKQRARPVGLYLHSSMERLKAFDRISSSSAHIFTFQYGEIKSFDAMAAARVQMEFTFQYGEIKSPVGTSAQIPCPHIYIPVWRD